MAGDDPTLGELARNIAALTRSVETLNGRVLTVDVWSAERQTINLQIAVTNEGLSKLATTVATLEAERKAEREKDRLEAKQDRDKVQSFRRSITFAVLTSLVAPLIVAALLLIVNPGGS